MSLLVSQQKIVAVHDAFRRNVDPRTGAHINLVEHNGDNDTWVTELYTQLTGAGNHLAWCAQTVSVANYLAHTMALDDFSMGAWNVEDKLAAKGLALEAPEVGAVISYAEGSGHVGQALVNTGGTTWLVGEGNYADQYEWVERDLAHVPGGLHGIARTPGVAADLKAAAGGPPPPAPPGPFGGHPLINWTGHAQVWMIGKTYVLNHGWRFTKAEVPPDRLAIAKAHAGQDVFHIGNLGAERLKKLATVPYPR